MTTMHIRINIKAYSAESAPFASYHDRAKNFFMSFSFAFPANGQSPVDPGFSDGRSRIAEHFSRGVFLILIFLCLLNSRR